ncbi:MAG: hypothetical protein ACE5DR_06050 [Thermodesulfobacteriota bacterium]
MEKGGAIDTGPLLGTTGLRVSYFTGNISYTVPASQAGDASVDLHVNTNPTIDYLYPIGVVPVFKESGPVPLALVPECDPNNNLRSDCW